LDGADEQEIIEAIEVGKMVRKAVAAKIDEFASSLVSVTHSPPDLSETNCGCS
jgi:hypothetical protein